MATYTDNYNLTKPTMSELADIRTINGNMDTIDEIMHGSQVSIADAYDPTLTYDVDDLVMYDFLLYKCITAVTTPEAFDANKWTRSTAIGEIPTDTFTGATSQTAGSKGLVPAPSVGDQDKFLKADGTWSTPAGGGGGSAFNIYHVAGEILKSKTQSIKGAGSCTIITNGSMAIITFDIIRLSGNGSASDFEWGLSIDELRALNSNIPNITPIDGGQLYNYPFSTSSSFYGSVLKASAEEKFWIPARYYENTYANIGAYASSENWNGRISGICYGTISS